MQRIPAGDGTEAGHARSPTVNQKYPDCSSTGSSSRHQAPVESESLPEICDPVPDARCGILSEGCKLCPSVEELAREVARVQGQPAGEEEGSESSDENVPLPGAEVRTSRVWTTTPAFAHAGRSCDVSKRKVGKVAPGAMNCENPQFYQTALRTFLKWVKERMLPLVENVEIDGTLLAHSTHCFALGNLHHHGSQLLAAVMDRWQGFRKVLKNHPTMAAFILILLVTYMRPYWC